MDGKNNDSRQEQCSIYRIPLPNGVGGPGQRIESIKASNLKSQVVTEDGQVWFWGGYFYDGRSRRASGLKQNIDGFNLLNEEEGVPKDKKIVAYGMGFAHDIIMVEEEESVERIELETE